MDAAPASACPCCPCWWPHLDRHRKAASTLLGAAEAAQPGEAVIAAGSVLVRHRARAGQRLGRRPRPGSGATCPRGGQRLLVLGDRGSAARHRRPHRGTSRAQPSQPGAIPPARHRRADPAAADRSIEDRQRTAPGGQPGAGRRALRDHRPGPRTLPAVPLVSAYDDYERLWLPPAPRLFQRRVNREPGVRHSTISKLLGAAVARAGLASPDGQPMATPRMTSAGYSSPTPS